MAETVANLGKDTAYAQMSTAVGENKICRDNSATLYLDRGALLTNSAMRVSGRH